MKKMTRFFVEEEQINGQIAEIIDDEDIYHFYKVLRAKKGDKVIISDGVNYEYDCVVAKMNKKAITLEILDKREFLFEPDLDVTLYQGVPKGGKMDDIIRKCIEIGVNRVVPVRTDRVDVNEKGRSNLSNRLIRWKKISKEAAKQSQRGIVPEVRDFIYDEELYEELKDYDLVVWPYELEKSRTIKDKLRNLDNKPKTVAIVIGPEGGFSDEEAAELDKYEAVSIGKSTLRTETAGVVTLGMVMYELEL